MSKREREELEVTFSKYWRSLAYATFGAGDKFRRIQYLAYAIFGLNPIKKSQKSQ